MDLFVVPLQGAITVHAESEEAARKKVEEWATVLTNATPSLLMPEIIAVLMNACEVPSHQEKKAKKDKVKAQTGKKAKQR